MILKVYSVRDSRTEVFNTPFFQKTHGEAERSFQGLCRDPQSMIAQFPDDYDLYFLGEYDDNQGLIKPLDTPQHIVKAIQLIQTSKN